MTPLGKEYLYYLMSDVISLFWTIPDIMVLWLTSFFRSQRMKREMGGRRRRRRMWRNKREWKLRGEAEKEKRTKYTKIERSPETVPRCKFLFIMLYTERYPWCSFLATLSRVLNEFIGANEWLREGVSKLCLC